MNGNRFLLILLLAVMLSACQKPVGRVLIDFSFAVEGEPLQLDTCCYENAAGNRYNVSEVQFFISSVTLEQPDGSTVVLNNGDPHYVDVDIDGTLHWRPDDEIPIGHYSRLIFTFGLDSDQNRSNRYPDPPENAMSWPATLGGGYHYMKINGWWMKDDGTNAPFNLHTGRGQQSDESGYITDFIDNNFRVVVPLNNFVVVKGENTVITLQMDVNRWFDTPNVFDFNIIGGSIMQNQAAQELLKANGHNVFEVIN